MASAAPDVFVARRLNMELRAVPAMVPLMPLFAMRPVARATDSMSYPRAPAMEPTYLNVSPMPETVVFALLDAAARTSAKCVAFATPFSVKPLADRPKAVMASVTMSETVARSSPDAAAKFITPDNDVSMSSVFQPAIAIYVRPWAASSAVNLVVAPISRARLVSAVKSSPVAPLMACTLDMVLSNPPNVEIASETDRDMPKTAPACNMGLLNSRKTDCRGAVTLSISPTVKFHALPTAPRILPSTLVMMVVALSTALTVMSHLDPVMFFRRVCVFWRVLSKALTFCSAEFRPGPVLSSTINSSVIRMVSAAI